jgi:predicted 3-demethylubiquinone-9 3-methyltransferase (glyoxalase superfamily)
MNNKIYPCLWFDGQAKAAAELYGSAFGDVKIINENPFVVMILMHGQKFMLLNGGADVPAKSFDFFHGNL